MRKTRGLKKEESPASSDRIEIRICGVGGQGVVLAGNLLGLAAQREHAFACASATYGPETRGTTTKSEVIVSNEWIDFPHAELPRYVLAFSQKAYDRYCRDVAAGGTVFYDSSVVKPLSDLAASQVGVPALDVATKELQDPASANLVMLGHFVRATRLISVEALSAAAVETFGEKGRERSLRALKAERVMG
ncbi:MAG: 2-oxoacid:acceptor oxidoreductase family protein [Planctomycetota bacterium]|nr:2-oxoacid:acceptor oxidoreductase family protein [Planctomycetota bacterium]